MKKSISSLILVLLIVATIYGGELIFKVEKQVTATEENRAVIAEIDTTKYKAVRVGVSGHSEAERGGSIYIETLDGSDAVSVGAIQINSFYKSGSIVVNVPGKRLRITANTSGKYKVFVWSE